MFVIIPRSDGMNIFARIMSHGFSLAVIGLLIVGFIYRGELFPDLQIPGFPAREAPQIADNKAGQADDDWMAGDIVDDGGNATAPTIIRPDKDEPGLTVVESSSPEKSGEPTATDRTVSEQMDAPRADDGAGVDEPPVMRQNEEDTGPTAGVDNALEPITAEETVEYVPAADATGKTGVENGTETASVDPSLTEITSVYKALAKAREAYWTHDYPLAESSYRKMIELSPDSPDGYGELGNMYFAQGMRDKASSEYYEAGLRLVDVGRIQKAWDLVGVIKGLDGQQADKLEAYILNSVY
jgi:hypothetical protein